LGKTRRSAASAKPKRSAGDSATAAKKPEKKKRPSLLAPLPTDPSYRYWRKVWMGLLGAAIVFSALAWWQQATTLGNLVLALAYACIFTAFYIDFTKLRKMRKAAIEQAKAREGEKGGSGKKATKGDTAAKGDKAEKGDKAAKGSSSDSDA